MPSSFAIARCHFKMCLSVTLVADPLDVRTALITCSILGGLDTDMPVAIVRSAGFHSHGLLLIAATTGLMAEACTQCNLGVIPNTFALTNSSKPLRAPTNSEPFPTGKTT